MLSTVEQKTDSDDQDHCTAQKQSIYLLGKHDAGDEPNLEPTSPYAEKWL